MASGVSGLYCSLLTAGPFASPVAHFFPLPSPTLLPTFIIGITVNIGNNVGSKNML